MRERERGIIGYDIKIFQIGKYTAKQSINPFSSDFCIIDGLTATPEGYWLSAKIGKVGTTYLVKIYLRDSEYKYTRITQVTEDYDQIENIIHQAEQDIRKMFKWSIADV